MRQILWGILLLSASPAYALRVERLASPRAAGGGSQEIEVVAGQALVKFSSSTAPAQRASALQAIGASVLSELPSVGWTVVGLPASMKVADGLRLLQGLPGVLAAEPDHAYRPSVVPNDTLVYNQYALANVDAFSAWNYDTGSSTRVTVALIDTGIDPTHPDLAGKFVGTSQYCAPDAGSIKNGAVACVADTPISACNHATRVAGIAAADANNGIGIAGVSWGANLLSMRVFNTTDCNPDCTDAAGLSSCATDDAAIIEALAYLQTQQNTPAVGKIVVNMSLGGPGGCPGATQTAVNNAAATGLVLVIATGNEGTSVDSPANCAGTAGGSGVIPVGATDQGGNPAGFSNRGPELAANGLTAPGINIETTDVGGGYTGSATGTSFSTPQVAGAAALILSAKASMACSTVACPQYVQSTLRGGSQNKGPASLGPSSIQPSGNALGSGQLNLFQTMTLAVKGTLAGLQSIAKPIAFPNPFRVGRDGMVSFQIPPSLQGSNTVIKLYTVGGEFVKELTGLSWDGKNADGNPVASGTYIFLVTSDAGKQTGRLALIR